MPEAFASMVSNRAVVVARDNIQPADDMAPFRYRVNCSGVAPFAFVIDMSVERKSDVPICRDRQVVYRGRITVKVVPSSARDCTSILPPWAATTRSAI